MDKYVFISIETSFRTISDRVIEEREIDKPINILEMTSHVDKDRPFVCLVNSEPLLREQWEEVYIRNNDIITIMYLPLGGGQDRSDGKRIGEFVAGAALLAFAAPLALGSLSAIGGSASILPGFGVLNPAIGLLTKGFEYFGTQLMLGSLQGPPKDPSSSRDISGSRNYISAKGIGARLGGSIPVVYGEHRVYPDFASRPYSYFENNYQFLNQDMIVSQGYCDVEDIKIGGTPITSFPDVETRIIYPDPEAHTERYYFNLSIPVNLDTDSPINYRQTSAIRIGTTVHPTSSIAIRTRIDGMPNIPDTVYLAPPTDDQLNSLLEPIYIRAEYRDVSDPDSPGAWLRADGRTDGSTTPIWTHSAGRIVSNRRISRPTNEYEIIPSYVVDYEFEATLTPSVYEVRLAVIRESSSATPTQSLLVRLDRTTDFVGGNSLFETSFIGNDELDGIVVPGVRTDGPDGADVTPTQSFIGPFLIGDASYTIDQLWVDSIWGVPSGGRSTGYLRVEVRVQGSTNWTRLRDTSVSSSVSVRYNPSIVVPLNQNSITRSSVQVDLPPGEQSVGNSIRPIEIRIAQIKQNGDVDVSCSIASVRARVEGRITNTSDYTRLQVKMRVTEGISQSNALRVNCIAKKHVRTFASSTALTTTESFSNDIVPIFIDMVTNTQYGGRLPLSRLNLSDLHAIHTI